MVKRAFRIEARLGVPAPQLMVWEALADLEGLPGVDVRTVNAAEEA